MTTLLWIAVILILAFVGTAAVSAAMLSSKISQAEEEAQRRERRERIGAE